MTNSPLPGRAAVRRHRAALANGDLPEWRQAYPAMVGAITEAYVRLRREAFLAEGAPDESPSTVQGCLRGPTDVMSYAEVLECALPERGSRDLWD